MQVRFVIAALAIVSSLGTGLAGADPAARPPTEADTTIATEIEHRLSVDRTINAQQVEIDVRGGHVTLRGRVRNDDAKERATALAKAVDGVEDVQNRLTAGTGGTAGQRSPGPIPDQMPGAR